MSPARSILILQLIFTPLFYLLLVPLLPGAFQKATSSSSEVDLPGSEDWAQVSVGQAERKPNDIEASTAFRGRYW
jgi:hypothetical protein